MHRDILNLRKSGMQSNKLPLRGKASLKQRASGEKIALDLLVQSLPYQVKWLVLNHSSLIFLQMWRCMAQSRNHQHLLRHPTVTSFLWLKWQRVRRLHVCAVINLGLNAVPRFFSRNIRLYILFVITLTWSVNSNEKVFVQNISRPLCLSKFLKTCNGCNAQPSHPYLNGSKTQFSNVGIYFPM